MTVVVRYMPSNGLKTAFRVHVLPEILTEANLKFGQLCKISGEDGTVGYGIAWRAEDRMGNRPKNPPAKMTETMRSAFAFENGSKVKLSPAPCLKPIVATRIVFSDETPREWRRADDIDDPCWKLSLASTLFESEALAVGINFEIIGRNKNNRRRLRIDSIESGSTLEGLFSANDKTVLVVPSELEDRPGEEAAEEMVTFIEGALPTRTRTTISTEYICGLVAQCEELNQCLRLFFRDRRSYTTLIHGYGGTGKSTLLQRVSETQAFRKVVSLERDDLIGKSVRENQQIIQNAFSDAAANEPSIVLMDDLDQFAPTEGSVYHRTLIKDGLAKIKTKQVFVIAATRAIDTVNPALLQCGHFRLRIELDIPDTPAREQFLRRLHRNLEWQAEELLVRLAARTRGYTGRDLDDLCEVLIYEARRRHDTEHLTETSDSPPAYSRNAPIGPGIAEVDIDAALAKVRPSALGVVAAYRPNTQWKDVGGLDHLKKKLDEIFGYPVRHKAFLQASAPGWQPAKGILLYGPPGCSKTMTAQAVANVYDLNFIAIKGAELISMYVGESERAVRDVFRKARAAAPCVVFFDEIDAIGGRRESDSTKGLNVLTTLLTEIDGFEPLKDVFILAATNRPEALDPALMRAGRFGEHIYLGPPDASARQEVLKIAGKHVHLSADVDLSALAVDPTCEGFSCAELVSILNSAHSHAIMRALAAVEGGEGGEEAAIKVTGSDLVSAIEGTRKSITEEMLQGYEAFARRVDNVS